MRRTYAAIAALALPLIISGCGALSTQDAAALISDEAAGSRSLYLTDDADIQATLERIAERVLQMVVEVEPGTIGSDVMNMEFLDIVFVSGHRGPLEFGMPGNGTASISPGEDAVLLAMTGTVMACWGMKVTAEGEALRTSVFNPGCEADALRDAEWSEGWPGRPEPISSPDGFEFGIPPSVR